MTPSVDLLRSFLDDIVAHPENPSLWLVLGDWLEDQGDERAELVRLTWRLQYEPDHADFPTRQARVQELLAAGMVSVRPRRMIAGIECAWIPPGEFLMGSPEDEPEHEEDETQHRVRLTSGFWMGVYPVTQGQWTTVMGSNPCFFQRSGPGTHEVATLSAEDQARFPVECVSSEAARDFCLRLGPGFGLPTEAQWEYACRASTRSPFHFGTRFSGKEANCGGTPEQEPFLGRPSVVGSYVPNAWGLYDMHGNIQEWCADIYRADYQNLPADNPLSEQVNDHRRVLRGGSWGESASRCRCARRDKYTAVYHHNSSGFRVVFLP
jgi:uncharacterized protein (TIGR02996 family)